MDEKRRSEIRQIVDRFRGQPLTQNVINEFCNTHKFEIIMAGELQDYIVQVEHDEMVGKLFPRILEVVQKLQYVPEYAAQAERRKIMEQNDEVRVAVLELLEEFEVKYLYVNHLTADLGNLVGETIKSAGTTAFNKALEVMVHIADAKFGSKFNAKHAADYVRETFEKAALDKKAKQGQADSNEPAAEKEV